MKQSTRKIIDRITFSSFMTIASLGILAMLLFYHLATLVPGWSTSELATRSASLSAHHIWSNPVNAPFTILSYVWLKVAPHSVLAVRGISAIYGALSVLLFYFIVRCWHSPRIAWLTSLLFASSTWFLHVARIGTPEVLQFGLLILMALGLWLQRTHHRKIILALAVLAAALSLYVPGLIWFVLVATIWQRHIVIDAIRRVPLWLLAIVTLGVLALVAPLVWAIANHVTILLSVLGLPDHTPAIIPSLKRLAEVPLYMFVRGPNQPGVWVGHTPIFDVFESAIFVFGVYAYWQHWRLARFASLLSIFVVTTVLVALGGPVTVSLLVPFMYLIVASGLAYLLGEWLSTFPRNPIARGIGVAVVVAAIGISCAYHLDRYFVAWPHTPQAQTTFSHHLSS